MRLPSVYSSRVARIFEDAEVSRSDIEWTIDACMLPKEGEQQGTTRTAGMHARNERLPFPEEWNLPKVSPALWKTLNVVSVCEEAELVESSASDMFVTTKRCLAVFVPKGIISLDETHNIYQSVEMSSRVWLVTGANSGLGLALAEHALSQNDKVIVTARNIANLPASLKAATPLQLDLNSSQADLKAFGQKALQIHGHIDVFVNMAGYGLESPVEELDADELVGQFHVNVFSAIYLIQGLLPSFRARKSGTIVNVSSIGSIDGGPGISAYSASKAALDSMTDALAQELAPWGIRVLIVQPGFFPTNWFAAAEAMGKASRAAASRKTGAYTDLYGLSARVLPYNLSIRRVGDKDKAAQRMYEVVTGKGLAEGLDLKKDWIRLLLGKDSGERYAQKMQTWKENIDATEKIWSSTELDPAKVEEMRKEAGLN
ncbi:hypothetical protein EW146_g66 [Bondarzewia mesenterica]|uniref:Ketoreductase domain-containing protein n=1 Tax=Bondarzewia mesenterica TaxID=1095465 RepID=A0A4S4M848_9AGAM|nr:hypothetical protein EW146_g66 [Bondarzewia mesenterica]